MCNNRWPKTHVWRSNTLGHESWQRYSHHRSEANDCHIAPGLLTLHLLEEQCRSPQETELLQWIFLLSLEHHKTNIAHPWKRRIIFLWGRCCMALEDEWNKVGIANGPFCLGCCCCCSRCSRCCCCCGSPISRISRSRWWWWWWWWSGLLLLLLVSVVLVVHNTDPPNPYPTLQETKWGKFWRQICPTPS